METLAYLHLAVAQETPKPRRMAPDQPAPSTSPSCPSTKYPDTADSSHPLCRAIANF